MEALPINPSPEPLRVGAIIQEACGFAWSQRHVLWPWIVLGAVLGGLAEVSGPFGEMLREGRGPNPLADLFLRILDLGGTIGSWLVFVLVAVFCHRAVLLPDVGDTSPLTFCFTAREGKFLAWSFGVGLFGYVLVWMSLVLGFVLGFEEEEMMAGGPLMLAGLILYLFGRWSLVFPSIALDLSMDIGWSWKQTRGNGWRMSFLVGFLPITTGVFFGYLLSYAVPSHFPVVHSFLHPFAYFIFTPVEIAVLSIAFRELTNWAPAALLSEVT